MLEFFVVAFADVVEAEVTVLVDDVGAWPESASTVLPCTEVLSVRVERYWPRHAKVDNRLFDSRNLAFEVKLWGVDADDVEVLVGEFCVERLGMWNSVLAVEAAKGPHFDDQNLTIELIDVGVGGVDPTIEVHEVPAGTVVLRNRNGRLCGRRRSLVRGGGGRRRGLVRGGSGIWSIAGRPLYRCGLLKRRFGVCASDFAGV